MAIDFQPIDQGSKIDFQPIDQASNSQSQPFSQTLSDIGDSIGRGLNYIDQAGLPDKSKYTDLSEGSPINAIGNAISKGAGYAAEKMGQAGMNPYASAAIAGVGSIAADPLNYVGLGENGFKPTIGLDPKTAALREARTGVPARQFQALYNDPGAIFAGKNIKQAGQDIGAAKVASGIDLGVNNDISSLTPDNIDRINPSKAVKVDDIQTVLGQIQNKQLPSPQQAQHALDSVNSILSQPSVYNNKDVFRQWSAIKTHINNALGEVAPDVRAANKNYAREALGQDFSSMDAVNKNGKPSKLGLMARGTAAAIGGLVGHTFGDGLIGTGAGYKAGEYINQAYHAPYVAGLQTAIQSYLDRKIGGALSGVENAGAVPAGAAINSYLQGRDRNGR